MNTFPSFEDSKLPKEYERCYKFETSWKYKFPEFTEESALMFLQILANYMKIECVSNVYFNSFTCVMQRAESLYIYPSKDIRCIDSAICSRILLHEFAHHVVVLQNEKKYGCCIPRWQKIHGMRFLQAEKKVWQAAEAIGFVTKL